MLLSLHGAASWLGSSASRGAITIKRAIDHGELKAVQSPGSKKPSIWLSDLYEWTRLLPRVQSAYAGHEAAPLGAYPMLWLRSLLPMVDALVTCLARLNDRNEDKLHPVAFEELVSSDVMEAEHDLVILLVAQLQEDEIPPPVKALCHEVEISLGRF